MYKNGQDDFCDVLWESVSGISWRFMRTSVNKFPKISSLMTISRQLRVIGFALAGFLSIATNSSIAQGAQDSATTPQGANVTAPAAPKPVEGVDIGEIKLELERFGAGGQARLGDWCGIRVRLNDNAPRQREVILRLESIDADGDKPWAQLNLTANPGIWQSVWLYTRLPFDYGARPGDAMRLVVFEAIEDKDADQPGIPGYVPGRLLGALVIDPRNKSSLVQPQVGMIGVIGQRTLGLYQYNSRATPSDTWHKFANEANEIVTGLTPEDLPDRWVGLSQFSAIVWADGDPAKLRGERSRALKDWISRGGHLIIVLPSVGQTWTNPASNELFDLMPNVNITSMEKVNFEPYRPLITSWNTTTFPKTSTVQFFAPRKEATPSEAVRILNGPDGQCVVVRREVGAGAVTMVGLDLNQTALSQFDLVDADVLWHRILGKSGEMIEPASTPDKPSNWKSAMVGRRPLSYDSDIPALIQKGGQSAVGVLMGFIVFALYWGVAGPIGFAILKRKGLSQHSWVFFVFATALFTALAWGGATALRPKRIEASHFTILDHVFGQPLQRGRMWASVLLPWYGEASLAVGEPGEIGAEAQRSLTRRSLNTITSWSTPEPSATGFGGFPDARGYSVDVRTPDIITVPTRQTVKQVQVDWSGGPRWEMPFPIALSEADVALGSQAVASASPGELRLNIADWDSNRGSLVNGTLVHKMPGAMRNIIVVVVRGQRTLPTPRARATSFPPETPLLAQAEAFAWSDAWAAGQPLSLDAVTRLRTEPGAKAKARAEAFFKSLIPTASAATGLGDFSGSSLNVSDKFAALAFFPLLPGPDFGSTNLTFSLIAPQRTATQGLDIARWFTRPCIIIVGELDSASNAGSGAPSPIPLAVDGELVPTSGRTLVRWIYPLPDNPPSFPASSNPVDAPPAPPSPPATTGTIPPPSTPEVSRSPQFNPQ